MYLRCFVCTSSKFEIYYKTVIYYFVYCVTTEVC